MRILGSLALAGVSLLAISTPVLAQSAPEGAYADDEIIVQARRKDESLQEVPLSVQAVTGADLQKLELRTFQDLTAVVPGLNLNRATNGIQNTVTMRGVSFNPTAAGPQTAVELYRNDVVTNSSALFQALYDIGQVEVLRGPQGTLRGRATPSGSISITTRKPNLSEVGGYVSGAVAEGGKWTLEGAVNVPILADRLGVRVAGYNSEDRLAVRGFNRFTNSINRSAQDDVRALRASVRAVPFVDVLTLDFNFETSKRDVTSFQQVQSRNYVDGVALTGGVPDISSRDNFGIQVLPNRFQGEYKFYNWQAELALFGQKLTYVGGRLDGTNTAVTPEDNGGFLANPVAPALDVVNVPAGVTHPFAQETFGTVKQRFHEVRLQNDERIAGIFDYVVGYMNLKSASPTLLYTTQTRCVGGAANCAVGGLASMVLGGTLRLRQDEENSFFGNVTAHIGERTEISGGIRRITFDRVAGLQSAGRQGALLINDREPYNILITRPAIASFAVDDRTKATIYSIAGKHRFSDDLMAYANYGTSFRPGNGIVCSRCNGTQGAALNAGGFLQQKDEKSNSVEIGFKSEWLDDTLTFNVSVFRQKFENYAVSLPEQIAFLGSYNAGPPVTGTLAGFTNSFALPNDVKVTGFEAEMGWRPSERFSLGGTLAYAKSKAKNGRVPCLDLNNDGFQDTTSPTAGDANTLAAQTGPTLVDTCPISSASPAPKWSATMQAEYNLPVGEIGEGYLRSLVTWSGKTRGEDVNPVDQVSSYALVNLYLGLRDAEGAWDISVFARNLTDTHRVLTRSGSRATSTINSVAYTSQYYNISTTAPREFGVSARFAIGSR